jgi:hypothetical protein
MKRFAIPLSLALVAGTLGGCYVYDPYYYPYGYNSPAAYDRSWNAAVGAMRDQGLTMTAEDRAGGFAEGRRGNIVVRAKVITQQDGRIRVEFNHGGSIGEDPGLPDRISHAYEVRMGRA